MNKPVPVRTAPARLASMRSCVMASTIAVRRALNITRMANLARLPNATARINPSRGDISPSRSPRFGMLFFAVPQALKRKVERMKIGKPKRILDPYEWLPGYGESRVSFRSVGADVVLEIEYDGADIGTDGAEEIPSLTRELRFKGARSFMKTPFPGEPMFELSGKPDALSLGDLTEFEESEFLERTTEAWRSVSSHAPPLLRHFCILFLSENLAFNVLAEDVILSEALTVG